jgi:hypothetical protein
MTITRPMRRNAALIAVVLALPLTPAAPVSAAAAVPAAKTVVNVPLPATWKVSAYSQLALADGAMTCTWRSMTRRAPASATAVSLNCTGPKNAYGMAYPLTVTRPALHVSKKLTVRFGRFTAASAASLLSYAPIQVPVKGAASTVGVVSMVGPPGWSRTGYGTAVRFRSPGFTSPSTDCELWVLKAVAPNPAAFNPALTDPQAAQLLENQLLTITRQLFGPTALSGVTGNTNPRYDTRYGYIGYGDPFVSITLQAAGVPNVEVKTTMIVIPTAKYAVGVPVIENGDACQYGHKYDVASELLLQSIKYPGQINNVHAFDKMMLGMWGSTDGHLAVADIFGANGHYIFAYAYNGVINISGRWYDATYSFAGDGMYSVYGPFVSFFPLSSTRAPYSRLFFVYHEVYGTTKSSRICSIAKGTNPATYMDCNAFWR